MRRKPAPKPWRVIPHARNIHTIEMDCGTDSKWEQWVLLSSDRHHDSAKSRHDLEVSHFRKAEARNAIVLDFGDIFDVMQGREDRRRSRLGGRAENTQHQAYFTSVVETHADFYGPWAHLFAVITRGNHENAVQERNDIDLVGMLCERIASQTGNRIHHGGYGGWIRFVAQKPTKRTTLMMHYFHGSGGGGMMTFDALRVRRNGSYIPDADVVVGGHVHESWHIPLARERLATNSGCYRVTRDLQHHVRCGTYKDAYGDGAGGWDTEKGLPPKPLGAVWMRLATKEDEENGRRIVPEFTLDVE